MKYLKLSLLLFGIVFLSDVVLVQAESSESQEEPVKKSKKNKKNKNKNKEGKAGKKSKKNKESGQGGKQEGKKNKKAKGKAAGNVDFKEIEAKIEAKRKVCVDKLKSEDRAPDFDLGLGAKYVKGSLPEGFANNINIPDGKGGGNSVEISQIRDKNWDGCTLEHVDPRWVNKEEEGLMPNGATCRNGSGQYGRCYCKISEDEGLLNRSCYCKTPDSKFVQQLNNIADKTSTVATNIVYASAMNRLASKGIGGAIAQKFVQNAANVDVQEEKKEKAEEAKKAKLNAKQRKIAAQNFKLEYDSGGNSCTEAQVKKGDTENCMAEECFARVNLPVNKDGKSPAAFNSSINAFYKQQKKALDPGLFGKKENQKLVFGQKPVKIGKDQIAENISKWPSNYKDILGL